jgi:hypothetical protein
MYTASGAAPEQEPRDEAMRVAAHRLAEQVALRTGLPLLDITQTLYAVMGASASGTSQSAGSLFARAHKIAVTQGDTAFARELSERISQDYGPLISMFARLAIRLPNPKNLTPAQRNEILRLARILLPYVPTPEQMTPNPRRRVLSRVYWNAEFTFQLLIIVVALGNVFVSTFLLFT